MFLYFGCAFLATAEEPTKIKLKETPPDENTDRPGSPSLINLYCSASVGRITVWSETDLTGTVSIIDTTTSETIATDCGMLGDGMLFLLPESHGTVRVEVNVDGKHYYAVIEKIQ